MAILNQIRNEVNSVLAGNELYTDNIRNWEFLFQSYVGGETYRQGQHLTRYQLETDSEYLARLRGAALENHCQSVISVYTSFIFRDSPRRDLGILASLPETEDFLKDADLEGRSLDNFMKEACTWSNVFGHCFIMVSKPDVGAATLADEIEAGVRPYLSLLTPLVVLDWYWSRAVNGRYELAYLKYLEDANGNVKVVKEWTPATITTTWFNERTNQVEDLREETNTMGTIPVILLYNQRSALRGIGVSSIGDVADLQRAIYNCQNEIDQSIRIDSHPSLVVPQDTVVGTGAGALIQLPANSDPGLNPYILDFSGANVTNILSTIEHLTDAIERLANIGAVRATSTRTASGVALETEFALLNARLSGMADELELAEEQIWRLYSTYQGLPYDCEIEYPDSFQLRDREREIKELQMAKSAATDPIVIRKIDEQILDWLGEEEEDLAYQDINPITGRTYPDGSDIPTSLPPTYGPASDPLEACSTCEYMNKVEGYCFKWDANVRPEWVCASWDNKEID